MASIKSNYIYSIAYQILSIVVPLVTIPYLSRIFGAKGLGVYSYTSSIAQYFMLFAMLGLNNYGVRVIARVRDNQQELNSTFSQIWVMQLFTGIISTICFICFSLLFDSSYTTYFVILILFVASSLFDVNWYFFGKESFRITVVRNAIIKLLSVIFIFAFIKSTDDLWLYVLLHSLSTFLSALVLWPSVLKEIKIVKPLRKDVLKHVKPNLVLFVPVIAISIYKYMDKIMLGAHSVEQAGYYDNVEKILTVVLGLVTAFGTVMLPRMSNLVANQDIEMAKRYIIRSLEFITFLSVPLSFGLIGVAEIFVPFYFGKGFEACILIQELLCITAIISSWSNVIRTQFLIPFGHDSVYIKSVISGAVVNFVINIILIPMYGALGAVIGTIAAELVVLIVQNAAARKEIPIIQTFIKMLPYYCFGIIMLLSIKLLFDQNEYTFKALMMEIVTGMIVYLLCVSIFKFNYISNYIKKYVERNI